MSQPSLFSADLTEPELADLGGLLAAHGHAVGGTGGTRLSILLSAPWRASALANECAARGVETEVVFSPGLPGTGGNANYDAADDRGASGHRGGLAAAPVQDPLETVLLRTERTERLDPLAAAWTRGAVKAVPPDLTPTPGLLRLWALAAGTDTDAGYELGLDPHARGTHGPLIAALGRCGISATVVGRTSPVARVTGRRRRARLAEMFGAPPEGVPTEAFPVL